MLKKLFVGFLCCLMFAASASANLLWEGKTYIGGIVDYPVGMGLQVGYSYDFFKIGEIGIEYMLGNYSLKEANTNLGRYTNASVASLRFGFNYRPNLPFSLPLELHAGIQK